MPAKLFAMIAISLDGYIEDESKAIDWMTEDHSVDALHTRNLSEIEAMVFGRKAHAAIAEFWQDAAAGKMEMTPDLTAQAERMTALPKYILSHSEDRTGWVNSHVVNIADVERIKAEAKRPVAVFAGAGAIQSVLAADLVDEVRLIVYPVTLGGGTPLFVVDGKRRNFALKEVERFDSGALMQTYSVRSL